MQSIVWILLSVIFLVSATQKIKIGVVNGPLTDRRENSEKFWSFSPNYNPSLKLEPIVKEVPWWTALEVARAICSVSKAGAIALSIQAPPRLSPLIASYADNLQLPLVTAVSTGGVLGSSQITLLPDTTHAAAALLKYWGWESFGYVYDTDTGPDQLHKLFESMDPHPQIEPFWRAYTSEDAYAFIQKLPRNITRLLLATSEAFADELFAKLTSSPRRMHGVLLQPVGTLRPITTPSLSQLTKFSFVDEGSQQLKEFENRWKTMEMSQRQNGKEFPDSALVSSDTSKVFHSLFTPVGDDSPSALQPDISTINCFNYSTGITFKKNTISGEGVTGSLRFNEDGYRVGYTLNIMEATPYSLKKVGSWSDGSGLQMPEKPLRDSANIRNRPISAAFQKYDPPIRVTSILNTPFLQRNAEGGFEGYIADLVDALINVTGRKFTIQLVKDGRYGVMINNEWAGMIGELVRNEADIVLADLTKTKRREEVIDFGRTFMTLGLNILLKRPEGQDKGRTSFGPFSFLTIWSVDMWMTLLLILALFGTTSYFISRFIGAPDRIRALESKRTDNLSPCGSFWYTIGSLLQRDTGIYPRSFTYRLWAILWWTFCFFVLVSYISALTAALIQARRTITTTHSRKSSQEVLEDLLTKGSPDIGVLRSGSSGAFFRFSMVGQYHDFGRYLEQNIDVMTKNLADGVARVKQSDGSYAFIMESTSSLFAANSEPCDTIVSSGYLTTRSYAAAMHKNSTIKELMDSAVLSLLEDGTLRQLYEKWWHLNSACEDPNMDILPDVYSRSMKLHEVSGIFYILCIGAVLALASTFIEHYISSKRISLD